MSENHVLRAYISKRHRRAVINKHGEAQIVVDNKRIGVIVAVPRGDGEYSFGWSLCKEASATHGGDKYDNDFAVKKALARASADSVEEIPQTVLSFMRKVGFEDRAARYFKGRKSAIRKTRIEGRKTRELQPA